MKIRWTWILSAGAILCLLVSVSYAWIQDSAPPGYTNVVAHESMLMARGEGRLVDGKATIAIPTSFCQCAHPDKPIQCIVSPIDEFGPFSVTVNLDKRHVEIRSSSFPKYSPKFCWLMIGVARNDLWNPNK